MKIDVIDNTRSATSLEKFIMNHYDQKARYVVLDKNGEEFTVQFTEKSLSEFCPSRTVSEMKASWLDGIRNRISLYTESIKTSEHPYWTKLQCYYAYEKGRTFPVEHHIEIPVHMTKEQKKFFQSEIEKLEKINGELLFVKIIQK